MIYDRQLNELWLTSTFKSEKLRIYAPSFDLLHVVEQYFLVDNSQNIDSPAYILPDLSAHLLLHEIQDKKGIRFCFSVVGSRSEGFLLNRRSRKRTFIIRFVPGVLPKLLAIAGKALNNQSLALAEFFPDIAEQLSIVFLSSAEKQLAPIIVFKWLEAHLLRPMQSKLSLPNAVKGFIHYLKNTVDGLTVQQAAKEIGFSERYLHKIAIQYFGMNPNKAIRVQRLLSSFEHRMKYPTYNWSDIAYQAGYTDQSHLIAEYQEMLARTPRQLFR